MTIKLHTIYTISEAEAALIKIFIKSRVCFAATNYYNRDVIVHFNGKLNSLKL